MADSTADSTGIIIIDSTTSDTQNMTATVSNSLVGDFAAGMGPIAAKCDAIASRNNGIKDQISGMIPSEKSLLDEVLANAMNAAFQSSAWATAAGASDAIKGILDRCAYFKDVADGAAKYADASKFIGSLAKAAAEKAGQAMDAIFDQFGGASNFPELGIGKALADIMSTGRTVYDKVEDHLEDIQEALSPIIEYGKSAVNTLQSELSAAAKELGKLDKLIDCLVGIGGPDYTGAAQGMMDQLDCYYDKIGVFSDTALPNFGEFDLDTYLTGIGSLSGNPTAINNIKKSVNLYSKTEANAAGAIAQAKDLGIKTPSALAPAATADSIAKKTEYISESSKTSYTVPGIPGKTEDKVVTIPEPEPVTPPPISSGDPPDPEPGKVPYATFVKESVFETLDALYYTYDPGEAWAGEFLSNAYSLVNKSVEDPEQSESIKLEVTIIDVNFVAKNKYADETKTDLLYTLHCIAAVRVNVTNNSTHKFSIKSDVGDAALDKWYTKAEVLAGEPTVAARGAAMRRSINNVIKSLSFSVSDLEGTIGGFF